MGPSVFAWVAQLTNLGPAVSRTRPIERTTRPTKTTLHARREDDPTATQTPTWSVSAEGTPELLVFVTTKEELRGWIRAQESILGGVCGDTNRLDPRSSAKGH